MFNLSKKNYVWLATKDNKWERDMKYDQTNTKHELKIRGLCLSKL